MSSPKLNYEVGDTCWFGMYGEKYLIQGRVIGFFTTPAHPTKYYIIEPNDTDFPHLEIRDALLMASEKGEPLPCWTDEMYAPS